LQAPALHGAGIGITSYGGQFVLSCGDLPDAWISTDHKHTVISLHFRAKPWLFRSPPRQLAVSFGVPELGSDHWARPLNIDPGSESRTNRGPHFRAK
jgi:hypothetical protein